MSWSAHALGDGDSSDLKWPGLPVRRGVFEHIATADCDVVSEGECAVLRDLDGNRVVVDDLGAEGPDDDRAARSKATVQDLKPTATLRRHAAVCPFTHQDRHAVGVQARAPEKSGFSSSGRM